MVVDRSRGYESPEMNMTIQEKSPMCEAMLFMCKVEELPDFRASWHRNNTSCSSCFVSRSQQSIQT